jgi:hypothetical protein
MRRTLETAISDKDDLILHRASDLLDALPWQRVRNLHTHDVKWMVGNSETGTSRSWRNIPVNVS